MYKVIEIRLKVNLNQTKSTFFQFHPWIKIVNEGNIDKAAENKRESESKEEENESNIIMDGFWLI